MLRFVHACRSSIRFLCSWERPGFWSNAQLTALKLLFLPVSVRWALFWEEAGGAEVRERSHLSRNLYRRNLFRGLSPAGRCRVLMSHYALSRGMGFPEAGAPAGADLDLARLPGRGGEALGLSLRPVNAHSREGQMSLILSLDGRAVYECFFTFFASRGSRYVLVGCLQGPKSGNGEGRELVHKATQALDRQRPRDFLMHQLRSFAAALGFDGLYLVGQEARVNPGGTADYDALWRELGAEPAARGHHYWTASRYRERPSGTLPSRKRAEHRRRAELMRNCEEKTLAALRRLPMPAAAAAQARAENFSCPIFPPMDHGCLPPKALNISMQANGSLNFNR